ncbi:hypothetical protein [Frankia sp. EI5c]|uniref:hypothetical protein n=1 Tax=Frankia sp. EI5c TaxID=683316 RepID=UPI000A86524D|nr:hypothetical protein [Frankia sp. EI5c]
MVSDIPVGTVRAVARRSRIPEVSVPAEVVEVPLALDDTVDADLSERAARRGR